MSSDERSADLVVTAPGHYRQEFTRCGKGRCRKCNPPEGETATGHGPYWYRYFWAGGKQRKRYVGKNLPDVIQTELEIVPAALAPEPSPPAAVQKTRDTADVLGTVQKTSAVESVEQDVRKLRVSTVGDLLAVAPNEPIDLDSVHMKRSSGRTRVTAVSVGGRSVVVGFLDRDPYRHSTWRVRTPDLITIASGFRTRQDALLRLVEPHALRQ